MANGKAKLNDIIKTIDDKRTLGDDKNQIHKDKYISNNEVFDLQVNINKKNTENLSIFNKFKANQLKNKTELEAARIMFNTRLEQLKHRADASERESKAFWDAKSVEISESIKTYVQKSLRNLEIERLDNSNEAIKKATEMANQKLLEVIENEDLVDALRDKLIRQIMENLDNAMKNIQENSIASKYDLN